MAKQGHNKTWKRAIGLSFLRDQTVERERGEENREEEEEEEKKMRRRGKRREVQVRPKRYGTLDFWYGTTKLEYESLVCMIIILPKPRVLLGFHLNPKIMESKVGKTLNSIIRIWNPSFEDGFMV